MSPRAHAVDPARLAQWCVEHLGSPPEDEIFRSGYLSVVIGLRLADDREVVVKVRPDSPRIAACIEVQRRVFQAGYPCPQPLTGAAPFGGDVATAEAYVPGGAMLPSADHAALAFAEAFARLIRLAPRPAEVSTLDPAPSWAAWNHAGDGLWPGPEDTERFLGAYCHARGRELSADELERSWAAGVWTRAYDAKYQHTIGQPITSLSENEARERLRRTGTGSRRP